MPRVAGLTRSTLAFALQKRASSRYTSRKTKSSIVQLWLDEARDTHDRVLCHRRHASDCVDARPFYESGYDLDPPYCAQWVHAITQMLASKYLGNISTCVLDYACSVLAEQVL